MLSSPCRISDRPRRHHCSAFHANLVRDFRAAAQAQEMRAELHTRGYDTETEMYFGPDGAEVRLTFKAWLIGQRIYEEAYSDVA